MGKNWIKLNVIFARVLAVLSIVGILWGWNYIGGLNTQWMGYPTICGIFFICLFLTFIILTLNILITVIIDKNKANEDKAE